MANVIGATGSFYGRMTGFGTVYDLSFSPGYLIGGVTWNGTYTYVSRRQTTFQGYIIKYNGFTDQYVDAINSPYNDPAGISMDTSGNLYSTDFYNEKLFKHSGFSSTIVSSISYSSGWYVTGITIASGNTFAVVPNQFLHRKHQGFTSTILAEHSGSYTPQDTSWDGTNELGASTYSSTNYLVKYQGFSGTVLAIQAVSPGITRLEWDNHIGQQSLPSGWAGTWGPVG